MSLCVSHPTGRFVDILLSGLSTGRAFSWSLVALDNVSLVRGSGAPDDLFALGDL